MPKKIDIQVEDNGSIVLLRPLTPEAETWLKEHTASEAQWFDGALACEPRYIQNILTGAVVDGLEIEAA